MKIISVCIFICAFFLLRPYQLQQSGLSYSGDDRSYFAHAAALVFAQFPSYEKEYFNPGGRSPTHGIGPGLMAAPFVFVFSLLDRLSGSDIVYKRTLENIPQSWSIFGFVFASSFYFWVACFLLYKGLRECFNQRYSVLAIILLVFCQGIPLFVFRRPIFSHVYEFFLQCLLVYLLFKNYKNNFLSSAGYVRLLGIAVVIALVVLVRHNNLFAALVWPLALLCCNNKKERTAYLGKKLIFIYVVFVFIIICLKVLPDIYNQNLGYAGDKEFLLARHSLFTYFKRILHILFQVDWGLIYTTPFAIIGLIALFIYNMPLKRVFLWCLTPLLVNLYIVIVWFDQGAWYGYRYLVASLIPLLVYPLAILLKSCEERYGKKINFLWIFIAIFPLLSMLSFEGNNTNLTLNLVKQNFGYIGWGNNTYQLEVWKTLLFHPLGLFFAIFKGGLLYIVYLVALLFKASNMLPSMVLEKYPVFQLSVMLKVALIYFLPFLLYWVVSKARLLDNNN